jgi:hypothetical protein
MMMQQQLPMSAYHNMMMGYGGPLMMVDQRAPFD